MAFAQSAVMVEASMTARQLNSRPGHLHPAHEHLHHRILKRAADVIDANMPCIGDAVQEGGPWTERRQQAADHRGASPAAA